VFDFMADPLEMHSVHWSDLCQRIQQPEIRPRWGTVVCGTDLADFARACIGRDRE
jgi:hypothetical protein